MASAPEAPDWGALPFSAVELVVAHVSCLPRHQTVAAVSALRLVNRHWRSAVDDAVRSWCSPFRKPLTQQHVAAALRRWRHLEQLTLVMCRLGDAAVQALGGCRRLQQLTLEQVSFRGDPRQLWETVAALPSLRSLTVNVAEASPSAAGLEALAACSSLTTLELSDAFRDVDQVGEWHTLCLQPPEARQASMPHVWWDPTPW